MRAVAALFVLVTAGSALAEERNALTTMVEQAEDQVRLLTPLRAEIRAQLEGVEGKKQDRLTMLVRNDPEKPGQVQTYLEFHEAGLKVLVLGGGDAYLWQNGKTREVDLATQIGSTNWTIEDLLPFTSKRCAGMRIVDTRPDQMTITCELAKGSDSQYMLIVYKMDREKAVPSQILYYKETMSNLVKMMRAGQFELVGSKWRPKHVEMRDFKLRTEDVFDLEWEQDPKFPPEVFDPGSLSEQTMTGGGREDSATR